MCNIFVKQDKICKTAKVNDKATNTANYILFDIIYITNLTWVLVKLQKF